MDIYVQLERRSGHHPQTRGPAAPPRVRPGLPSPPRRRRCPTRRSASAWTGDPLRQTKRRWAYWRQSRSSTGIESSVDDGSDPEDDEAPRPAAAITGRCHHVALLRTPELVVDYLEGPPPPEGGTEWAGVFRPATNTMLTSPRPSHRRTTRGTRSPLPRAPDAPSSMSASARSERPWRTAGRPGRSRTHADVASTALVADELAHLVGRESTAAAKVDDARTPPVQARRGPAEDRLHLLRTASSWRRAGHARPSARESGPGLEGDHASDSASQRRSTDPRPTRTWIRISHSSRCASREALVEVEGRTGHADARQHADHSRWSWSPGEDPRRPSCSTWKPSPSGEAPHRPVPHPALGRHQSRASGCSGRRRRRRAAPEGSAALGLPDRP